MLSPYSGLLPTEGLAFDDLGYFLSIQHQGSFCINDLFTHEAAGALKDKTADAFKNLALIVSEVYAELWDNWVGYSAARNHIQAHTNYIFRIIRRFEACLKALNMAPRELREWANTTFNEHFKAVVPPAPFSRRNITVAPTEPYVDDKGGNATDPEDVNMDDAIPSIDTIEGRLASGRQTWPAYRPRHRWFSKNHRFDPRKPNLDMTAEAIADLRNSYTSGRFSDSQFQLLGCGTITAWRHCKACSYFLAAATINHHVYSCADLQLASFDDYLAYTRKFLTIQRDGKYIILHLFCILAQRVLEFIDDALVLLATMIQDLHEQKTKTSLSTEAIQLELRQAMQKLSRADPALTSWAKAQIKKVKAERRNGEAMETDESAVFEDEHLITKEDDDAMEVDKDVIKE
ncbi:hypothetical protein BDV97DRAFT_393612 [Delphinella strobiligena]|nr:hypothetical protein BDV97DRAFT_393612 [Delphinella strobiligena]